MAKLYIAKNKHGKYYTVIKNGYYKCEKSVSVNLPQGVDLEKDYGIYDCEYFLSCFPTKSETVELLIKITKIHDTFKPVENPYEAYNNSSTPELPF